MTITPALITAYKARRAWLCPNGKVRFPKSQDTAIKALTGARTDAARGSVVTSHLPTPLGHGDCIRFRDKSGNRQTAVVAIVADSDMGAPWEEHDGHGPVSDWRHPESKRAGELVLNHDSRSGRCRFYDFAEACKIARRDGWGTPPYEIPGETLKARAARAAMADFDRLKGWCNDSWHWVGVCLFLLPRDGVERDRAHIADAAPFGILEHAALWGIESDSPEYHAEVARELTAELA